MKHYMFTLVVLTTATVLISACTNEASAPRTGADGSPQQTPNGMKTDAKATVAPTLAVYEDIRAKLAADDISGAAAHASALETAAATAGADGPAGLREPLSNTAEAAQALGKSATDNPDAVRKAFGEVSRHVVTLLARDPSLRDGTFLFECPMAQGYQR